MLLSTYSCSFLVLPLVGFLRTPFFLLVLTGMFLQLGGAVLAGGIPGHQPLLGNSTRSIFIKDTAFLMAELQEMNRQACFQLAKSVFRTLCLLV